MATRKVQLPNVKRDARGTLATTSQAGNLNGRERTSPLTLGVIHGTVSKDLAGLRDIDGVIGWWRNPAAGGSAHAIADAEGNSAYTVDISHRAPHCGNMNYCSFGLELISTAPAWLAPLFWRFRTKQLHETARWIAWANLVEGLPIQEALVRKDGTVAVAGWTTHRVLGQLHLGTDHTDPGPWYPMKKVLGMANWYRQNGWVNGVFNNPKPVV